MPGAEAYFALSGGDSDTASAMDIVSPIHIAPA